MQPVKTFIKYETIEKYMNKFLTNQKYNTPDIWGCNKSAKMKTSNKLTPELKPIEEKTTIEILLEQFKLYKDIGIVSAPCFYSYDNGICNIYNHNWKIDTKRIIKFRRNVFAVG